MNLAAFAVITIRERQTPYGDDIRSVEGLGRERPVLAWPLTISMLALAGLPGTAGFIGKLFLIEAAVESDFTWLGVLIAIGTMVSLGYYLRVLAYVWMRGGDETEREEASTRVMPAIAGGSPEADAEPEPPQRVTGVRLHGDHRRSTHPRGRGDRLLRRLPRPAHGLRRGGGRGDRLGALSDASIADRASGNQSVQSVSEGWTRIARLLQSAPPPGAIALVAALVKRR